MEEKKRIVNNDRNQKNMEIQSTEVNLQKEDENKGIGYEIVIDLD